MAVRLSVSSDAIDPVIGDRLQQAAVATAATTGIIVVWSLSRRSQSRTGMAAVLAVTIEDGAVVAVAFDRVATDGNRR